MDGHQTVEVNGHPFHCHVWGPEGAPVIVMMHGFPEWGGAWAKVASRLAPQFRCVAPDMRGYGQSWCPEGIDAYSVGAMLADVFALLETLGGGAPVRLVAHDWGAALAYVVAASRPDLISQFAVMNGVHPIPFQAELAKGGAQADASQYMNYLRRPESTAELAADDFAKLLRFVVGVGRHAWLSDDLRAAYLCEWSRPGALDAMINWYRASSIKVPPPGERLENVLSLDPERLRIRMPHLLIWGEDDQALLPATRDGVVPLCDQVRIETLSGADHWLHHQKPDQVAKLLRGFFT